MWGAKDNRMYTVTATNKETSGDWLKKKVGFEEAARHSADFAARFDD